nr:putative zinc finger, CCHC-type [Tanacetum cinerariifolium]
MAGNTVKDMTTNFGKLDKFEGYDFRRWQKKMHFLLTMLNVVYVLTTLMLELSEDAKVEAIRIRTKWENDDYICRRHVLNGMSDSLFDVYTNVESAKELWDSLESKYMAEDSSSKKFLVSNFNNYKMVDSRPVMEQYNELLRILGQYTQHGLKMDESISVSSIIDKLPPSWKDFKHTLKHGKDDLSLVQLEDGGKNKHHKQNKGKKQSMRATVVMVPTRNLSWNVGSVVRLVTSKGIAVVVDAITWWIDSGATTHVCKDRCWFKTYEPVEDGLVLYMGDDHFAPDLGKGSVALEFSFGKTITLFNVLYVPKLCKNLVSDPMLNKCGYKQVYESDKYILSKSEQKDGEAMINSIQNGDQPLPVIAQVSLAGNAQNAPPTLKDPKFWTAEEKKTRKIDRLARSLLIQGLLNDIYSLIDINETAKDLWDAIERQMRGSEYDEQDMKAAILYEYKTFKATEGEQLLDTYLRYLQVINDLKKCGYKKDNCSYFMIYLPSRTAMLSIYMFISMPYTIARAIFMHDYDMLSPSHGGTMTMTYEAPVS